MTTMSIDNHPLTQRRLQFIGIGVNKLKQDKTNLENVSENICDPGSVFFLTLDCSLLNTL